MWVPLVKTLCEGVAFQQPSVLVNYLIQTHIVLIDPGGLAYIKGLLVGKKEMGLLATMFTCAFKIKYFISLIALWF